MITNIYILICIGIWIYIRFIAQDDYYATALRLGAMYPEKVSENHEYWRIFTCNFIHVDFLHLFMNVYCIYSLGHYFEMIMTEPVYLALLLVCMLSTGLIVYASSFYFESARHALTLGASGVFFGYLGAMIGLALFAGGYFTTMLTSNIYAIIINLGATLFIPHISKSGHLGGMLGGYLFIFFLYLIHYI